MATARGKSYRSVNWVYRYYTSFNQSVNLGDKTPYYFEQIRRKGFEQEERKKRKCVYTTHGHLKTLVPEEKKAAAWVVKGNKLKIRAVSDNSLFVLETIRNERR